MTLHASPVAPSSADSSFSGSVPSGYERDLGPLLFEFSAADLARRVSTRVGAGSRLLEVACGTGIATEHLRRELPGDVEIVATDLNPGMLEVARRKRGHLPNVTFAQADALALPFEDSSFDAVVCQFGIMFFPDRELGMAEMTRVLQPGGRLLFNVWDSLAENRAAEIAHQTIGRFFDSDPPRFLEVPFGLYEIDPIKDLVLGADLEDLSVHVVSATVRHDALAAARGFVEGTPGVQEIRDRANADLRTVTNAVAAALEHAYGSSTPAFPLREIVFEARKRS